MRYAIAIVLAALVSYVPAKPQSLNKSPVPSPNALYRANVEWDDAGFMGRLRMLIYNTSGLLVRDIELPEINPEPANLSWIDNEWVGCESFIGDNGSGFFYVHVPTGRAFLLEIVSPKPNDDWLFSVTTNDATSTAAQENASKGHSSYFPLLLRNAPENELDYFLPDVCEKLRDAVDALNNFRQHANIKEIEILSDADTRPDLGAVVVANLDGRPAVVYYPMGAPTPAEMFARVKTAWLPDDARRQLDGKDAPDPEVRWTGQGDFIVEGIRDLPSGDTTTVTLMQGKFEGVSDQPFSEPTPIPMPLLAQGHKGKTSGTIIIKPIVTDSASAHDADMEDDNAPTTIGALVISSSPLAMKTPRGKIKVEMVRSAAAKQKGKSTAAGKKPSVSR